MAIPHDPLFGDQNEDEERDLAALNRRLRNLGLPDAAHKEIASYLGEGLNTVKAWLNVNATMSPAPIRKLKKRGKRTIVSWGDNDTKKGLLRDLSKKGKTFTRSRIVDYLEDSLGWEIRTRATKGDIIKDIASELKKDQIAALMDAIAPKVIETEDEYELEEQPLIRLPDMLEPDTYLNRRLSSFPRGTRARQKADLALALLGEVTQTPQAGVQEAQFREYRSTLRQVDETVIWPLRWGNGLTDNFGNEVARWVDPFIAEMWFRATLTPGPDMAGTPGRDALQKWQVTVDYYQVYEATDLVFTSGWPVRDDIEERPTRTKKQIADKIKEKADYEAYKKEQAKKKRQKAKRNR